MTRKSIATNMAVVACDVCGRTLLRGENADVFLHGGTRRNVCELCTSRAVHEGWIREGVDGGMGHGRHERGGARSLLGRFRQRRSERDPRPERYDDEAAPAAAAPVYHPATYDPAFYDPTAPVPPVIDPAPAAYEAPPARAPEPHFEPPQEPRNVRAIPTNDELKVARALQLFNASPHPRTVAGITRSLGAPLVAARPSLTEGSVVSIVVGWELSWYRYEADLADEASGVRVVAQGSELDELDPPDRVATAEADERGELHPAPGVA